MQVFRLTDTFYPSDTVSEFESFVWVERYRDNGDFKITAHNDISILETLPIGSLVSHTDTREVMIVEDHEISRNKKRDLIVTVTGRSFEVFTEGRLAFGSTKSEVDDVTEVENTTGTLLRTGAVMAANVLQACWSSIALSIDIPWVCPEFHDIENLNSYLDILRPRAEQTHQIKRGQAYPRIIEFLAVDDAGIKNIRPIDFVYQILDMVIYDGEDKTTEVVFHDSRGDLTDSRYFSSIRNYRNYAWVSTWKYAREVKHRDIVGELTGLDRRVLYTEAFDLKGIPADYEPPAADDAVSGRGQLELDSNPYISLMDATVDPNAAPKFKYDYDVGDLVTVRGEFGVVQTMRVVEHILTIDEKGQQGYPTLRIASL